MEIYRVLGKAFTRDGELGVKVRAPSGNIAIVSTEEVKLLTFSNAVLGADNILYVADGTDIVL